MKLLTLKTKEQQERQEEREDIANILEKIKELDPKALLAVSLSEDYECMFHLSGGVNVLEQLGMVSLLKDFIIYALNEVE